MDRLKLPLTKSEALALVLIGRVGLSAVKPLLDDKLCITAEHAHFALCSLQHMIAEREWDKKETT